MTGVTPNLSTPLTIFCDFDGPLVDVSERYYSTYQMALTQTRKFYWEKDVEIPGQMLTKSQFWQMKQERVPDIEIAMRSGLEEEEIDFFLDRVTEIVNEPELLALDRMQPGIGWSLALLHSQGAKLIVVTLRHHAQARQILCNEGLIRLFSGIYGTDDDHAAYCNNADLKTKLLGKALNHHHTDPQSAWMVGDTEADILAAQAHNIRSIGLTCGIRSENRLRRFQPTLIKSDLLSTAHYLLGMNTYMSNRQ